MMGMKETVSNIVTSQQRKEALNTSITWRAAVLMRRSIRRKHFRKAKALTVGLYNSGEFINNPPVALGENAVVVVASHKGNTPETIKAAEIARQHGAPVIGLTR